MVEAPGVFISFIKISGDIDQKQPNAKGILIRSYEVLKFLRAPQPNVTD